MKQKVDTYHIDEKALNAAGAIASGNLASKIKSTMKYSLSGLALGVGAGILIATAMGKCRLCFGFWGGIAGAGIGYLASPKKTLSADGDYANCCI